MKKRPRLEAGGVVGEEEHKKIIAELDELREHGSKCSNGRELSASQKQPTEKTK